MKTLKSYLSFLLFGTSLVIPAYAQIAADPVQKHLTIQGGYIAGAMLSSNASGFHLSLNPRIRVNPIFSVEGQLGYTQFQSDGLFGTYTSQNNRVNVLAGPRLYFNGEHRNTRPYANLLLGGGIENHKEDRSAEEKIRQTDANFALQTGIFVEFRQRVNVGVSLGYSAPKDISPTLIMMLQAGFSFPIGK